MPKTKTSNSTDNDSRLRLDKWLWAARFFKTRALATEAVSGGKVHVNDTRVKPAHDVRPGEKLTIRRGEQEFTVIVQALSRQRGPASVAAMLYEETDESRERRQRQAEQRRLAAAAVPRPATRPNKQQRRKIIRFTRQDD